MQKILVANRGEIAVRILRTLARMEIDSLAVYSEADRGAEHTLVADQAQCIGPAPIDESYCNIDAVLAAAQQHGATAVHPGYGFLSENPEFARRVGDAGLTWIGPPVAAMEAMASKVRAREIAMENGVPVIPGRALAEQPEEGELEAVAGIGFPLLLKASGGGGGIGMREVHGEQDLARAVAEARARARRQFGSASLLAERLLSGVRHIEVQVAADQQGNFIHLFERDCSLQRRRQKLIEEAPAPGISAELQRALQLAALRLVRAVEYQGVGTVEFLVDGNEFFFLEMNTRLQVEHGVSEAVCSLDLVQLQIDIANGASLADQDSFECAGHAIEVRVYAEDPAADFAPATGSVLAFELDESEGVRVDSGVSAGSAVGHHYDGLLCKLIGHGNDRAQATGRLCRALQKLKLLGVKTNQRLLLAILESESWQGARQTTTLLEDNLEGFLMASQPSTQSRQLALAAATIYQFRRNPPAADVAPWPGAYQLERSTRWQLDEETCTVLWRWCGAGSYQFAGLDHTVTMMPESALSEGLLLLEFDGYPVQFQFHHQGEHLWLWSAAMGPFVVSHLHAGIVGEPPASDGLCRTPGPGQILRLLVSEGDEVRVGDGLLVLESMKMESTLNANVCGRVAAINVAEGELVASDQVLLSVSPAAEESRA